MHILKAIDLNDQYAKAYLGLGSVYMKRSAELLDTAKASKQAVDPQALQLAEQAISDLSKGAGIEGRPRTIWKSC